MTGARCWPGEDQMLLLQAALGAGETARAAFAAWRSRVALDFLEDPGQYWLLPLLEYNLRAAGVAAADPLLAKLRGIARRQWAANQLVLRGAATAVGALTAAGLDPLLFRGAALAGVFYEHPGLRPMQDVDLLLSRRDRATAARLLRACGYRGRCLLLRPIWSSLGALRAEARFVDGAGQTVTLWSAGRLFDVLREGAVWTRLDRQTVRAPGAAESLLLTCAQGPWSGVTPPVRWVADAAMIARGAGPALDWDRLERTAVEAGLVLTSREALAFLDERHLIDVPPGLVSRLHELRVSAPERWRHRWRMQPPWPARVLAGWRAEYVRHMVNERRPVTRRGLAAHLCGRVLGRRLPRGAYRILKILTSAPSSSGPRRAR